MTILISIIEKYEALFNRIRTPILRSEILFGAILILIICGFVILVRKITK